MVVADRDVQEGGQRLLLAEEQVFDVLDEPVGAVLVRDVHVEDGELAAGVVVEHIGHGHVDDFTRTRLPLIFAFLHTGELEALAVVAEGDAEAGQVLHIAPASG